MKQEIEKKLKSTKICKTYLCVLTTDYLMQYNCNYKWTVNIEIGKEIMSRFGPQSRNETNE